MTMRISTIRNWEPDAFRALAGDLDARSRSSRDVHDGLDKIAQRLDSFSGVALESIKRRYGDGVAAQQAEVTVISLVQRIVEGVAQTVPTLQYELRGLEEGVGKVRGRLDDDGSVTLQLDATEFEKDIAKNNLEPSARLLLRQAFEMDIGAAKAFTQAANTDIPSDSGGSSQQHAPLSADLDVLRGAASETSALENGASSKQSDLDNRIRGKSGAWQRMDSYGPFGDFGGWLDHRRAARSSLLTGLAGSLYQTSSLFQHQEEKNAQRLS